MGYGQDDQDRCTAGIGAIIIGTAIVSVIIGLIAAVYLIRWLFL